MNVKQAERYMLKGEKNHVRELDKTEDRRIFGNKTKTGTSSVLT